MLRPPIRFAALTIATDAAGVAFTSGDVQTVLAVLGVAATLAFALIAFGRKDATTDAMLKSIQKDLEQHSADDERRFDHLEALLAENRRAVELTHQSVQDALRQMIELGTGRRVLSREEHDR